MKKVVISVLSLLVFVLVQPSLMSAAGTTYPKVNDYIISMKLVPAKVEQDYKNIFTKFTYRNGYGEVEGIVAHETANSRSTISSEIAYMTRNHSRAFVHAFADGSRVIEIHTPNYGAWGAGSYANQRFVHIELVREKSFDKFARSINNYGNYIASVLYEYNLPLVNAEKTGEGTLWSHAAVTKYLGGTTHADPHAYFKQWGYSWDQFVQLVTMKYKTFPNKTENTNRLGQIPSSKVMIYKDYTNTATAVPAGETYTNQTFYIKNLAFISGQTYYLLSEKPSSVDGVIGWAKAADLLSYPESSVKSTAKTLYFTGIGSAYSKAWGMKEDVIYSSLSKYKNQEFKVDGTETVGNMVWYRGNLDGKTVWIYSSRLVPKVERAMSRLGQLKNGTVMIYKTVGTSTGAIQAGSAYTGTVYYIKKQATINDQTYYLISKQPSSVTGVVGWVNSSDITNYSHTTYDKNAKTMYFTGKGSAYSKPWGGTKDLIFKDLSKNKNQEFKINLTEKVGNNTWYRGSMAGKTVWIHGGYLSNTLESATSRLGNIKITSVKVYRKLGSSSNFKAGSTYTNKVYYIKRKGLLNGQTYYLISKSSTGASPVGWIKSSDISDVSYSVVSQKAKTMYLKGTGSAYSKAWGGKKDVVYKKLSSYKNKKFTANLTAKVGSTNWYCGKLDGKTVWLMK
ncbi:SH3-like domain-containing protein [Bacillus sp. sid0103]|uniref:peptidoglycan recognition protein family protein n=1 Tax=Bacillus sp. sid0103 TaxID=2856337 RepID=UPI001C48201E|nr:GW dipeptide domain-containing protein [Bacillus sp. sid0103]MBV7504168.1 SH3-like domain-containing protein [Bacillus sp. sid0103]